MAYRAIRRIAFFLTGIALVVGHASAQNLDSLRPVSPERSIEAVIGGGAGFFARGASTAFQPTANLDLYTRTEPLNFTLGLHYGFSNPNTAGIMLGFRLPITETDLHHGFYGDLGFLFMDNGHEEDAFQTGVRAALASRSGLSECRLAAELRNLPFSSNEMMFWGGLEVGLAFTIYHEGSRESSRKDTLRTELKYVANPAELEELSATSSDAELNGFLTRFWEKRNLSDGAKNQARAEYEHRVKLANERYSSMRTLGASTDMGRVLILYGEADHQETAYSKFGGDRKFQLWVYHDRIKGVQTAMFLFLAVQGVKSDSYSVGPGGSLQNSPNMPIAGRGEFQQIYSNVPGEQSEGIPTDLPTTMFTYISNYRR
jgi:GWxTD domain-containing protein